MAAVLADQSDAADEGTDAHSLADMCLAFGDAPGNYIGQTMPLGNVVDEEMVDAVQQYLDYVTNLPGEHAFECRLSGEVLTGEPGGGGTADHLASASDTLWVTDFKYGRVPVQVVGNTQARTYAAYKVLGEVKDGDLTQAIKIPKKIGLAIVQPRCFSEPQIETITGAELMKWVNQVLIPGAAATQDPNAPRVPGEAQCQYCPVKGTCKELAHSSALAVGAVDVTDFHTVFEPLPPTEMSPEVLAGVAEKAAMVIKWLEAVKVEVANRLYTGREVPGWKLVRGKRGNREWTGDEDAIVAVLRNNFLLADETIFRHEIQSPSKILALPDVKQNADLLAVFITQKEGSVQAAPESDKRAVYTPGELIASNFETID